MVHVSLVSYESRADLAVAVLDSMTWLNLTGHRTLDNLHLLTYGKIMHDVLRGVGIDTQLTVCFVGAFLKD